MSQSTDLARTTTLIIFPILDASNLRNKRPLVHQCNRKETYLEINLKVKYSIKEDIGSLAFKKSCDDAINPDFGSLKVMKITADHSLEEI